MLHRENVQIAVHQQYAPGHLMTKLLWKFGQNPLRNVEGLAHKRNYLQGIYRPADILKSNNQIYPSENLVKNDKLLEIAIHIGKTSL